MSTNNIPIYTPVYHSGIIDAFIILYTMTTFPLRNLYLQYTYILLTFKILIMFRWENIFRLLLISRNNIFRYCANNLLLLNLIIIRAETQIDDLFWCFINVTAIFSPPLVCMCLYKIHNYIYYYYIYSSDALGLTDFIACLNELQQLRINNIIHNIMQL